MLRYLENLSQIKKAITKKNIQYYRISNILSIYMNTFRGSLKDYNKFKLFSLLMNFNKSESKFFSLCNLLVKNIINYIDELSFKECLSILSVTSNQNIFNTEDLKVIKEKFSKFNVLEEIKSHEKQSLLLNYLLSYSINYIESLGSMNLPQSLIVDNQKIFDYLLKEKRLSLKELIDFHYYFFLINDFEKFKLTSFQLYESSNLIRLSDYNLIIYTFNVLTQENLDNYEDLHDLMKYLLNNINKSEIVGDNSTLRIKLLASFFNTSKLFFKNINTTSFFVLFNYNDLFYEFSRNFKLTLQVLPLLNNLKLIDLKKVINYFIEFLNENSSKKLKANYEQIMNCLTIIFSLELDIQDEILRNFIFNHIEIFKLSPDNPIFLFLDQKLLYNSALHRINEKYRLNLSFHEISETEIKVKDNQILDNLLKNYIKKVRFALFLQKSYILDNIFYFDYYIPTMKIGFLIHSETNIFEYKLYNERIAESYKLYKDLLQRKYGIEFILVNDNYILNQPDALVDLIKKSILNN